jgi:hypothetical protein
MKSSGLSAPRFGIDRVENVRTQGDRVVVTLRFEPRGKPLPPWLANVQAVTATLEDVVRTPLEVVAVAIVEDERLAVSVEGVRRGQRFVLAIDNLIPEHDTITVSYGVDESAFDPTRPPAAPEPERPGVLVDYASKDFASFRRLLFDVISHQAPGIIDPHEPDLGTAIVEVLAFAADHLSYFQDAVATEAYLETARRRVSVRRHARLTGYRLFEGCSARVWLHVSVNRPCELRAGYPFATPTDAAQGRQVFETLHHAHLEPALDQMTIWGYEQDDYVLPAGATGAMLSYPMPAGERDQALPLRVGSVLVFQQMFDVNGATASPRMRHAVALKTVPRIYDHPHDRSSLLVWVEWFEADALPFALPVAQLAGGRATTLVVGNVVAADHGFTDVEARETPLEADGTLRIFVDDPTFAVPYQPGSPASDLIRDMRAYNAVPKIVVDVTSFGTTLRWEARRDLIGAGPQDRVFAVEVERDGMIVLRFGDGEHGWRPDPHGRFFVTCRTGSGTTGHVGADVIVETLRTADPNPGVTQVRNPLPSGGARDQQALAEAKREAPEIVVRQQRCVADADYVALAQRIPDVISASVQRRWTGSSMAVDVYVHGSGDQSRLHERVDAVLAPATLLGVDVNVRMPRRVPIRVKLGVTYRPPATPGEVSRGVIAAAQAALEAQQLTLGTTVFASWFISAARSVPGVRDVSLLEFRRSDGPDARPDGFIRVGPIELAVLVDERQMIADGRPTVAEPVLDATA